MERGRAGRWFENVANALLERAVPRVREWLQSRFGPGSDVAGIRLEGRDVHVDDTRVPLGPRAVLAIARATFRVTSEPSRPLVLHALHGELRVEEGGFVAPVRFECAESVCADAWIDGALKVEQARWPRVDGAGAQASLDGSIGVFVTSARWALERGTLTSADATITIEADGELDAEGAKHLSRARVELRDARAGHFADAAAAITGAQLGGALTVLADARVDGVLLWINGLDADVTARTERSRLQLKASAALDETVSGTIHGSVAIADLLDTRVADAALCDGKLSGTVRAPVVNGIGRVRDIDLEFATSRDGVRVSFADAPASLAALALDVAGIETSLRVPPTALFTGELTQTGGDVGVETATSALLGKLTFSPMAATIRGKLSATDANAAGLFPAAVRPREGVMNVRALFEERKLHVEADSKVLELDVSGISLPLRDVAGRIFVDGSRIVIRSIHGRLYDGEVSAEGLVAENMSWKLRCSGVRIEGMQSHLAGALAVGMTLDCRRDGPLQGSGELRVDYPVYVALAKLTPTLGRYGVSTPDPRGIAPLNARFSFGERGVRFEGIDGRLDGVTVLGFATIAWTKELRGTLDVELAERLVRNSALLGLPALLSRSVALIVELKGTIDDPDARVDPLKTLGVADAVASVTSAFNELFAPLAPRPRETTSEIDAILDRILANDPRSDELIAQLVDRGIDPDDFEELLEQRRRARRR